MSADFFAGYLSGALGILVGNPLDILKVRLQASSPPLPSTARSSISSIPAPLPQPTYKAHFATASALFRGLPAPVLTYGALNALLFVSYNRSLTLLDPTWDPNATDPSHTSHPSALHLFTAGAVAGFATWVVSAPTELIKCRAQVASPATSTSGAGPTSSWAITRAVVRTHGPRGLYLGGAVTSARDALGYGAYFLCYEASTRAWRDWEAAAGAQQTHPQLRILLCGGLAGIATWASIFPLDVVKTRVQTQAAFLPAVEGGRAAERTALLGAAEARAGRVDGAWSIARQAYRAEGPGVFWRGLTVCCVRAFVVNAVQWGVYEWVMGLMRETG